MKFKHSGDASSVTYLGKEHDVDSDGLVDLPAHAAEHIAPHGFLPYVPVSKAELKAKAELERAEAAAKKKADAAAQKFVKLDADAQLEDLQENERTKLELQAIETALADAEEPSAVVLDLLQTLIADAK